MRLFCLIILLFFLSGVSRLGAAELDSLTAKLKFLRESVMKSDKDNERNKLNSSFTKLLFESIQEEQSILIDSIPKIAQIWSPEEDLKLTCWNTVYSGDNYSYDCIISYRVKRTWYHYLLNDASEKIPEPLKQTGTMRRWYGALYYEIIPFGKSKEKTYLLLAWDGNDQYSNMKVVDVLWFDEMNTPRFGKQVFQTPFNGQTRIIFEYSKDAVMSLKYYEKEDWIVFDHLSPLQDNMEGMYEFYVPDLSFDALQYRKNAWYFIQNVDVRGNQSMENYTAPPTPPMR